MAANGSLKTHMTQLPMQLPTHAPRLVRHLAELTGVDAALPRRHLAQGLGRLFDLPDSIGIANAQGAAPAWTPEKSAIPVEEIRSEFLRSRADIVSSTLRSFMPGGVPLRLRFPVVTADMTREQTMTPAPYLAFYGAQQREIDFRIRNLHAATREAVAAVSPRLAQLAALDAALCEPIATHHRRFFATVCELLLGRIEYLLDAYHQAVPENQHNAGLWGDTLATLRSEMQDLLLAEIEARLQPALGLLDALDEPE